MGKQRLSDGIDVHYGEYAISGVTVINSSRQLRNITALRIDATEIINGSRQLVNVAGYTQTSGNASIEHASSPTFELKDTTNNVTFKAYAQDSNAFVGTTSSHTLNIGTANTAAITVDTSQVVTFADDIVVPDQITHAGDTDTYMQFSAANVWRVVAAGSQVIKATGTTFEVDKTLHAESGIIAFGASPVITSRAADSEIVLKSQNESASNADQFHIAHQLGNVQLYNARGIMRYYMGSNSSTYIEGDGSYAEVNTAYGYTRIGAGNASYSHFYTDRPAYYFNKKLQVDEGIVQSHNEDLQLRRTNSSNDRINIGDTVIQFFLDGSEDMRLTNTGNLDVEGDVTAYSTVVASDERLKDNVVTIESALNKVKALRGVEFIWNKGKREGKQDIGVIAQEVEKVLPEVVIEKELPLMEEGTTYKTVDYPKLTAVLIEAIKEQQKEIEQLKKHSHPAKDMCDMNGYEELVARIEKMEKNYGNN